MIFHFKSKSFSFNMVLFLGPKETTERQGSRGSESSSRTDWRGRISYRSNISTNWQVILIFFLQLMSSQLGCKRAYSLCINFFFNLKTVWRFGGRHQTKDSVVCQRLQRLSSHPVCGVHIVSLPGYSYTKCYVRRTSRTGNKPIHGMQESFLF